MIIAIITLGSIVTWAVIARHLFRRWVRNDTFVSKSAYRAPMPLPHGVVAGLATIAALFFPVTALAAFITHNPPLSRNALETKIQALEAENTLLQQGGGFRAVEYEEPEDEDPEALQVGGPCHSGHHKCPFTGSWLDTGVGGGLIF